MALRYARRKSGDSPRLVPSDSATAPQATTAAGTAQSLAHSIVKLLPRSSLASSAGNAEKRSDFQLPPPGVIRGLILDADLVLSGPAAWCRGLALLLYHIGHEFDSSSLDRLWRNRHLAEAFRGRRELGDALDDYLHSLGLARGQRDEVLAASLAQWREVESQLHFLPGAREALRRIARAGGELALFADATVTGAELLARISEAGVADAIATVVTSVDVDRVLPDAACYQAVAALLGHNAAETLFVADEVAVTAGATAMGLSVAACGDGGASGAGWRVTRLDQLVALFDTTSALAKAG